MLNVVSARDPWCEPEIYVNVSVYNMFKITDGAIFTKSNYQPAETGIIQKGDVLLIESFYLKMNKSCELTDNSFEIRLYQNNSWKSIRNLIYYKPIKEGDFIIYSFQLNKSSNEIKSYNYYYLVVPYRDINNEEVALEYFQFDEVGDYEIAVSWDINYFDKILNEGFNLRFISVLDKVTVAQLETLKQIMEDSEKSSNASLFWVRVVGLITITIGLATIFLMWRQLKKMDEHYERQNEKEDKREEEKQIDLIRTLLTELNFLEKNLESYKETFAKKRHYPFYELWNLDVALYLRTLNHRIKMKETISLKKNLMFIKDKLLIINNMKVESKKDEEERGEEVMIKIKVESLRNGIIKIIDKDLLLSIKKSKNEIKKIINS